MLDLCFSKVLVVLGKVDLEGGILEIVLGRVMF